MADNKAPKVEASEAEAPTKTKIWKIKTPVEGYNGVSMGVVFADGVGETDDEWFAQRCREAGYEVK